MRADQTKVRQSLLNLLSNAAKFTKNGRDPLSVAARATRAERDWLALQRRRHRHRHDARAARRGSSSAFTQADASTTRKFGGTGPGPGHHPALLPA